MANAKFIKNKKGQKVSVVLDIKEYEKLMEDLEELDAIRAYELPKAEGSRRMGDTSRQVSDSLRY
jgi:hypothetical protein